MDRDLAVPLVLRSFVGTTFGGRFKSVFRDVEMIENSVCIFGEQFEHLLVPGDEMTRKLIRVEDLVRMGTQGKLFERFRDVTVA